MLRFVPIVIMSLSLSPVAAQTPRDIAQLLWPHGLPLTSNEAPAHGMPQNLFVPPSILDRPALSTLRDSAAPRAVVNTPFAGRDLARLRGDPNAYLFGQSAPEERIAAREQNQ